MESLKAAPQHRTVVLVEEPTREMYDATRIDAKQVPVIRKVMYRAQRDPVDDRRHASGVPVVDDVSGLQQRGLPQSTHSTTSGISAEDRRAKAVLVKAKKRLPCCVAPNILIGYQASVGDVGDRKTSLELDQPAWVVHRHHKGRRDDCVLARGDPAEIDKRNAEIVRRD